jgi:acyl-CoA thioesterase FadM
MVEAQAVWRSEVRLSELDAQGRLLPHRALEWMQEAAAFASTRAGYPPERYRELGAAWFIREVQLSMVGAARYGEAVEVTTWVSDLRRFRSRRESVIRAGGRVIARGQADWLFLEQDPTTQRVRPRHPDEAMLEAFPRVPELAIPVEAQLASPRRGPLPAGEPMPAEHRRVQPTSTTRAT